MEQYSKKADSKDRGMTLLELELFVRTAQQAGISPGACITGVTSLGGKLKNITATNDHSPKRHQINAGGFHGS